MRGPIGMSALSRYTKTFQLKSFTRKLHRVFSQYIVRVLSCISLREYIKQFFQQKGDNEIRNQKYSIGASEPKALTTSSNNP